MGGVVVIQPHRLIVVQRIEIRLGGKGGSPRFSSLPHPVQVVKEIFWKFFRSIFLDFCPGCQAKSPGRGKKKSEKKRKKNWTTKPLCPIF